MNQQAQDISMAQRLESLTTRHKAAASRRDQAKGAQDSNAAQLARVEEHCRTTYGTTDPDELLARAEAAEREDLLKLNTADEALTETEQGLTAFETRARELTTQANAAH